METDVEYLKRCIGRCLAEGLAEMADCQPADPIAFLAYWIYGYKKRLNEEEERKRERAQLKQEQEEAVMKLERIEKLREEGHLVAQKFAEQQKIFSEQHPENSVAELTDTYGAPKFSFEEKDVKSLTGIKEKEVIVPEENEITESKEKALENALDQDDLNFKKSELNEMPVELHTTITFKNILTETIVDEDVNQIPKEIMGGTGGNQPERNKGTEDEYDTQTEGNTSDEEYKSGQDLNSD
ncbi:DPY30 domain-containing protein 1-like [Hemicordylus capensis]|uniref:DPY30 domain-containing protein 1-like n=1 Tax=Hemicordylus capensis TaxID=884348 RepID=UPI002302A032|nr:DPY30 domain-containing protein 1-like [Hemicordylus capensis]XP_053165440.1 DPY30 domain-containing protein 1-like [Hemicordylus capensis]XP_053165441.1 DPY30 domain-containing protein 1-like [Hemicordylus capensis]XP_053165442.1 DPY30 domain-containing protein 1-like [Hemicordylus capensis]XP_053165444.1 DPY30 domain-containing protein 1-like [Hemicordylus capensis]